MSTPSLPLPPRSARLQKRSPWEIQRAVVFALFIRELRGQVEGRWLGLLWTLFEPVAHMAILLALFTFVRHLVSPGINPALFLVTGLVPFFLFRNVALRGADAVRQNVGLFSYRQVRPFDTLLSRTLLEVVLHGLTFAIVLSTLGWSGTDIRPDLPLELVATAFVLIALSLGLGLCLMVTCTGRPRVRSFVGLVFAPLYLLSGVIFPLHTLPKEWLQWLLLNPIVHLIDGLRHGFESHYPMLDGATLAYPAACALALCTLGMSLYRAHRQRLLAST